MSNTSIDKEKVKELVDSENKIEEKRNIIYANSNLGFSVEFPQSWEGNYVLKESDKEYIEVYFIGQSEMSKGENGCGLFMFYIGTEKALSDMNIDISKKIGTAKGKDYYYTRGTDYPVSALDISSNESLQEMITDEKERKLMQDDFTKAKEMEKHINDIIETFKEI